MTQPRVSRRATHYIVLHYLVTNLGYFGLLSTLVVALSAAGFAAGRIAVLVMVFTLTSKVAKIPLAPVLDRFSAAASVLLGCLMAAAGFASLPLAVGLGPTMAGLALAGVGISVNALASKQLAAAASDGTDTPARVFSLVNIGVNVSSAVAAPVALMFTARHREDVVLLAVAVAYGLAGVTTFLNYSRLRLHRHAAAISSWRTYLQLLRQPGLGVFLMVNFFGWFLYGQLFNVLAMYVSRTLAAPGRLGWIYTLNALLVVFLQLGVTRLGRRVTRGDQSTTVVFAYGTFAVAFAAVSVVPGYPGAVAFVVLFTLAEMMFVPSVDVLLLELIGTRNRAVGYSILSISTALGEATGGGSGVAGYRWLADRGHGSLFWLLAAGAAAAFALVTAWSTTAPAAGRGGAHRAGRMAPRRKGDRACAF
jgi:MFS transporter, DHA1 family, multidrug resistance protein